MTPADQVLFERWISRRDGDAFTTMAGKYAAMVYAVGRRITGNVQDAEEVAQATFQALAMQRRAPRVHLGAWLHRVAMYRARDVVRSGRRRMEREARYALEQPVATGTTWTDLYDRVDEAIAALPEKQRVVIVAHYLEGKTHEAIARELGISRPAVTQRAQSGLEGIRTTLKKQGVTATVAVLGGLLSAVEAVEVPVTLTAQLGRIALAGPALKGAFALGLWQGVVAAGLLGCVGVLAFQQVRQDGGEPVPVGIQGQAEGRSGVDAPSVEEEATGTVHSRGGEITEPVLPVFVVGMSNYFGEPVRRRTVAGTASISGTVVDIHGSPLAGMVVCKVRWGDRDVPREPTGPDGVFQLGGLPPGSYRLTAIPEVSGGNGIYSRIEVVELGDGETITDIRLVYEGVSDRTISGRVTDSRGKPIAGATLKGSDMLSSIMFDTYTVSGPDGFYVLEMGTSHRCSVVASHPEYSHVFTPDVVGGATDVNFVLEGLGTLTGRVVDDVSGEGVVDFKAGTMSQFGAPGIGSFGPEPEFSVEGDGQFRLTSVDVGMGRLYIRAPGYAPRSVPVPAVYPGKTVDLGTIRLDGGVTLRGEVVDLAGRPISGVKVQLEDYALYPESRQYLEHGHAYDAITDEEGRFTLERLSTELEHYNLVHPDYPRASGELRLSPGTAPTVRWVLAGRASVAGRVYVNGEPVKGAQVRVDGVTKEGDRFTGDDTTNSEGGYLVRDLLAGNVKVMVSVVMEGTHHAKQIEATTNPERTTEVDAYFETGDGTITGRVTRDGLPVAGASVTASSQDGEPGGATSTAADGTYKIGGLLDGEYDLKVAEFDGSRIMIIGRAEGAVVAGESIVVDIVCEVSEEIPIEALLQR